MKAKLHFLIILLALFAGIHQAAAQGTAFTYQGRLDSGGNAATGNYDLKFTLFATNSGGASIAGPVTNTAVAVSGGLFTTPVDLGANAFNGGSNWLEIAVRTNAGGSGTFTNLTPRQQVTPTPYAIMAASASNLLGGLPTSDLTGTVGNAQLAHSSISVTAGAGLSGGGAVALGGSTTLTNTGVLSVTGNSDITASTTGGAVTLGDTATSAATASTMVKRDATGNFSAGTITANLAGNATLASNVVIGIKITNAVVTNSVFSGNGNGLTNLNAAQLSSGVVSTNVLPGFQPPNFSTIGGGQGNSASGEWTTIGGGNNNTNLSNAGTIAGGQNNFASGQYQSTVGGGYGNQATNSYATVPGGINNIAGGQFSFAAGNNAQATNDGAFVWADSQGAAFGSTNNDSFNVRAQGGVVFVTSGAGMTLDGAPVLTSGNIPGLIIQQNTNGGPNLIGGSPVNFVSSGVVGATIGGGGAVNLNGASGTNSVTANFGTVGGGFGNTVTAIRATVGGGSSNSAGGSEATVSGGATNTASANFATIGGGRNNTNSGPSATIGGGATNTVSGAVATVAGGYNNLASNHAATVGGGDNNTSSESGDTVAGGEFNTSNGGDAAIGGGNNNTNLSSAGVIAGGQNNTASGQYQSVVGGGFGNQATNSYATVPGGINNLAGGQFSFAAGQQAQALHQGAFVWADSQNATFSSTANDQFLIRAQGGVGINTSNPNGAALSVQGTATGGFASPVSLIENNSGAANASPALRVLGYGNEFQGVLSVSAQGTGLIAEFGNANEFVAFLDTNGNWTANSYSGDGSKLTGLNISQFTTGLLSTNILPGFQGNFNAIGGGQRNSATGIDDAIGGGQNNLVGGNAGVIGGGQNNLANGGNQPVVSGGFGNIASASYAVTGGGLNNTNSGIASTIGGGESNIITTAGGAVIGGGENNNNGGPVASIGGGQGNNAGGSGAVIGGGFGNTNNGSAATIGGGESNTIVGAVAATIGGGFANTNTGEFGTIAGGANNSVSAIFATVGGGGANQANGTLSTVSGGDNNITTQEWATISGGASNNNSGLTATIGGGGYNTIQTSANYSTIGGGLSNTNLFEFGTIAGGGANLAGGVGATVGGGLGNQAIGSFSTVPGGVNNLALGNESFAAGLNASANDNNSFVWGDGTRNASSQGSNSFAVLATGGVFFYTIANPGSGGPFGAELAPGATSWSTISDRNAKKNFQPVDTAAVLDKLAAIPIQQWNYKWEKDDGVPNIGPMAQDFKHAFYPGRDDKSITTLEFDGVELAAIQGLNQKLENESKAKDAELQQLKQQNELLAQELNELKATVKTLGERK